jgi:hypothetical protein
MSPLSAPGTLTIVAMPGFILSTSSARDIDAHESNAIAFKTTKITFFMVSPFREARQRRNLHLHVVSSTTLFTKKAQLKYIEVLTAT